MFSGDQLISLAEAALGKGDLRSCRGFLLRAGGAPGAKGLLCTATYRLAKLSVSAGQYEEAKAFFAEVAQTSTDPATKAIAQERGELLNRILVRTQPSARDVSAKLSSVRVSEPVKMRGEMLLPEIAFAGCPAAYRSGYDPDRSDPLSQLIRQMKAGVEDSTIRALGQYLAAYVFDSTPVLRDADLIIPVPTHPDRQTRRGYSIPQILAEEIARMCAVPLHNELVQTEGDAVELRHVPRWHRREAISGAFSVGRKSVWLGGQTILLVDDVITTGATLREIADLLTAHSAKAVMAVALAHTERSW